MNSPGIVNSRRVYSSHWFPNLDQRRASRLDHPKAMAGDQSRPVDVVITNPRWSEYQRVVGSDTSFAMPINTSREDRFPGLGSVDDQIHTIRGVVHQWPTVAAD
jgi:hypothetical protein